MNTLLLRRRFRGHHLLILQAGSSSDQIPWGFFMLPLSTPACSSFFGWNGSRQNDYHAQQASMGSILRECVASFSRGIV